jgi:hypothetical protein
MKHLLHRHRHRAVVAQHYHAQRIADEDQLDIGLVNQDACRVIVRRHHADLFALLLHLLQVGDGGFLVGHRVFLLEK